MFDKTKQQQAIDMVLVRATTDRAFRTSLITNPHRAIREAFGINIPDQFRIKFIEKEPAIDALIVLPEFEAADGELSDDSLEQVAGGTAPMWSDETGHG